MTCVQEPCLVDGCHVIKYIIYKDIHIQVKGLISRGFVLEAREILL